MRERQRGERQRRRRTAQARGEIKKFQKNSSLAPDNRRPAHICILYPRRPQFQFYLVRGWACRGERDGIEAAHTRLAMSSSRKRKAPDAAPATAQASTNSSAAAGPRKEQPLVRATPDLLKEMRRRVRTVVDETTAKKLAEKASSTVPGAAESRSKSSSGGGGAAAAAVVPPAADEDPTATAYLRAFQAAVASHVRAMCEIPDPRELQEEDTIYEELLQSGVEAQAALARLAATRARIACLSVDTCRDALRVSEAADDRACSVLEARTKHARREKEIGGPLPLISAANGDSGAGGGDGDDDGIGDAVAFSGIDPSDLEPRVTRLIAEMSELPGPLKTWLQELPEHTAALAASVQNAELVMEKRDSRTEALLGKAPPTPLPSKKSRAAGAGAGAGAGGAAGEAGDEQRPEDVRSAAREARVEQARKEWEAGGVGMAASVFN